MSETVRSETRSRRTQWTGLWGRNITHEIHFTSQLFLLHQWFPSGFVPGHRFCLEYSVTKYYRPFFCGRSLAGGRMCPLTISFYIFFYVKKIYVFYFLKFSRRFYPKRLTVHSGYTFCFISMCVPWELNPQPFVLLTQCSTTEPQEHHQFTNASCEVC